MTSPVSQQQPEAGIPSVSSLYTVTGEAARIFILLFVGAVILFINIGGWDLWNPDEPRYAQVAREMMQTGNYLVPHINSEIYSHKPPLFFWLIALASKPFGGVTAASARIPSAFAALGVILLTYLLGRTLYNPSVGFLSGIILLTTAQFFWLSLRANIDMTLTLWTTLSLFLFYWGYTRDRKNQIFYFLSYFFMGLAVLTKGPVGFAIPLITIALFLVFERQSVKFREIAIFRGIAIIAVVSFSWLIPACIMGGADYTKEILFKQTLGRTVDSFSHKQPFYTYLKSFPADFNPWTFFFPSAVIFFWKKKTQGERLNITFPLLWFLGTFAFFSLISGKRNIYLLPLYPAVAIMMAKFWCEFITTKYLSHTSPSSKTVIIPFYILFGGLVIFTLILSILVAFGSNLQFIERSKLELNTLSLYPVLLLFFISGIAGLFMLRKKLRAVFPFSLIVATMFCGFMIGVNSFFPSLNAIKSAKPFCDRIAAIVKPTDKLVTFRFNPESFNYFLNRTPIPIIDTYDNLKKLIHSPDKFYCLISAKYEDSAPEEDKSMVTILDESQIGHRKYYLITNKTDS